MKKLLINYLLILLVAIVLILSFFYGFLPAYTGSNRAVTMADFKGYRIEEVEQYIDSKDLKFSIKIDSSYDQTFQLYTVIKQDPEPHSLVKSSRTIYLTINNGKPPKTKMPKLIDLSFAMALKQVEQANLKIGKIEYKPYFAHNLVLNQFYQGKVIKENEFIDEGSEIDLLIGKNSNLPVEMPDLSGLTLVEAKLVLQENQLSLGIVMSDSSENQLVNKQLPKAGDKITQGSIVDIWLNAPEN